MKQQTRNHFIFIVILIALFWGLVPAVHAQTPFPSDNEVHQIASKLYCRCARTSPWMCAEPLPVPNGVS
jgi:hypothetical protein